jgi:cell division protein FtsB
MKFLRKKVSNPVLATLKRIVLNRYFWVTGVAFFYMLFFDAFDLRSQWKMRDKIKFLEQQKAQYQKAIAELEADQKKLSSDPAELERLARERYLMKRNNEDLYIIVPDSQDH